MKLIEKCINKICLILKKVYYRSLYGRSCYLNKGVSWRKSFVLNISDKGKVSIGKKTFFNNNCSINARNNISIGEYCLFGEGVKLYDHDHVYYTHDLIRNSGYKLGSISIGNNCWIGSNVVILKNTIIGNNCVISAGCVVSGTIPNNSIVKRKENNYIVEQITKR